MVKQVIVVNKGLGMSKGKMAAQVSHASMAFMTRPFYMGKDSDLSNGIITPKDYLLNLSKDNPNLITPVLNNQNKIQGFQCGFYLDIDSIDWLCGSFTKVICEVKNENGLIKVVNKAIENGLIENKDFFKIIDEGRTEFDGIPTWTCIGFRPMPAEKIDIITKRLQLFKE